MYFFKMTCHRNVGLPSSSSSSTGLMTTGGWVGLGTFSWVSVLMTPLSCGLVGFAVGAGTWLTWSSCGISSFSFRTTCPVKMIKRPVYLFELVQIVYEYIIKEKLSRQPHTFVWGKIIPINNAWLLMMKSTVRFLAASWLVLPIASDFFAVFL